MIGGEVGERIKVAGIDLVGVRVASKRAAESGVTASI